MPDAQAEEYMKANISPTLTPALVEMCRAKPADPVVWLANYLFEHKPAPPVVSLIDEFRKAAEQVFFLADEDGSGALDYEELMTVAQHEMEAEAILRTLDSNRDGVISVDEWCEFFVALFQHHRPAAEGLLERCAYMIAERSFMLTVRALFDEFDKDQSGELELGEVMVMLNDDEQGKDLLAFADANGDKVLSLQEWMRFFFMFWRSNPRLARANVGYLMQRAGELRMMPAMPPPRPAATVV